MARLKRPWKERGTEAGILTALYLLGSFYFFGLWGMFLILPIVYFIFWEITPDIHDRALKSMK